MTSTWPQMTPEFAQHVAEREPWSFPHGLPDHPLLSLEAIADLTRRLDPASVTAELADKPIVMSEEESSVQVDVDVVAEQILQLDTNNSWFNLLNIHQVPAYKTLVDEIVDAVAASSGIDPSSLNRRCGFIFASSPGAVTSAHFDIEQSLCMQLRGERKLGIGRFASDESREREIERYWSGIYGRMDVMPEETHEFDLRGGVGVFIPPYRPHWITNGSQASLSLTVSFFNKSNTDEAAVQAFNHRVRRIGVKPRAYGQRPGSDRAKASLMRTYGAAKSRLRPGLSS